MKNIYLFILLLLLSPLTLYSDHNTKVYTVILPKEWKPYYFIDNNGKPAGFSIDLFEAVADEADIKYKYRVVETTKELYPPLKSGEAHILTNLGIAEHRKSFVTFTDLTDTSKLFLYKRFNSEHIKDISDITEVATVKANIANRVLAKNHPELKSKVYPDHYSAIRALLSGEIDAFCYPQPIMQYTLKQAHLEDKITTFYKSLSETKRAMAVSNKNPELIEPLNRGIKKVIESGKYDKIYIKWFGKPKKIELTYTQIVIISTSFVILLLVVLFIIYRNKLLSTQVELQNKVTSIGHIIDKSLNEVFIFNSSDYKFTYLNHGALKNIGYTFDEMQSMTPLDIKPEYTYETFEKLIEPLYKEDENQVTFETIHKRKDGSLYPIEANLQLMEIDNTKQFVAIILDVTQRKKYEHQMLVQSRLAQMGELITMIAHQWRQPLGSIAANIGDLKIKQALDKYDKEHYENKIDNISDLTQHLSNTITDFRDFFKEDKEEVNVKLEEIVAGSLSISDAMLNSKSIKVTTQFLCNEEILTYKNELKQVVLNLLKNAEDAIVDRKIKNGEINIKTYKYNDKFNIEVKDNAGGIKEDIIDKIFEPYFTTKDILNGTGLGLYMSKQIIEEHCKGRIFAENSDIGAVFRIVLFKNTSRLSKNTPLI